MFKVPICWSLPHSLRACDFHQECFIWILYYMCCPSVLKGSFNMWILCSVACEKTMRHIEKCRHLWAQMHFAGPLAVKWSIQDGTTVSDASYCYNGKKRILYIILKVLAVMFCGNVLPIWLLTTQASCNLILYVIIIIGIIWYSVCPQCGAISIAEWAVCKIQTVFPIWPYQHKGKKSNCNAMLEILKRPNRDCTLQTDKGIIILINYL